MRVKAIVLGIGLTALVGGGAAIALRPKVVRVESPRQGPIQQTVVVSGQVMPPAEIRLASFVSSTARKLYVREGDSVDSGQLLLELDEQDAEAQVAQAEAALASARAGRSELSRLSAPQAETELSRAETNLAEARRRLAREKHLFEAGVTPQEIYEEVKTAEELAEAQRQAALLQVRAASAGGSQAVRAQANVALAEAQLAVARVQLARHEVRAPASGVIISREVEPGDAVLSGSPLFVLSATGATRLRVEPDERNLALLRVGQRAVASAEAFPDDQFDAEVQYIAPSVDPARGTVEVRLLVDEPPEFLRQNMTVSVEITVAKKEAALLVSRSSVVAEKLEPHVLTLGAGRVNKTPVELGLVGDRVVEVVSGLDASDRVITDASPDVQPGDRARAEQVVASTQANGESRTEGL